MSDFNLDDCLRDWRSKYGKKQSGRTHGTVYWRIDIKERRYCLIELIKVLRTKGMEREEFETSDFIARYLKILFGEAPWSNKEKQKSAFAAAKVELIDVVSEMFRAKSDFEDIEIPEPAPAPVYVKPEEPMQSEKTSDGPVRKWGKAVSPELLADMPEVENVQDVEFAKFLGVDPNE